MNRLIQWIGGSGMWMLAAFQGMGAEPAAPLISRWEFNLPLNYASSSPAVASNGTIYQGSFGGWMFALNPAGKVVWKYKAGREIKSSPAIADDGTIYFGSRDWKCYALTPEGHLKWSFATGAWVDASPAIAVDGTVYFGSWDHFLYALTPEGIVKWKFDAGGVVNSSPAIAADGTVLFGSQDKHFYALTPEGHLKWSFATGGGIKSSPAIGPDGAAYFGSTDGFFYAINADGTLRWKLQTEDYLGASPVLDEAGNIWVFVNWKAVVISPSGQQLWQWGQPSPPSTSLVALQDGGAYFAAPWRLLRRLDTQRNLVWEFNIRDDVLSAPNITEQGLIYVCTRSQLLALSSTNPVSPAKSSWPQWRADSRHTGRAKK